MSMETTTYQDYERTLIQIAHVLPPHRVEQLVDFARFLKAQLLSEEFLQAENMAEVEADNAQWNSLLATDEAQSLLDKLAGEALAEHRAGKTKEMAFSGEGRIVPG